MYYNLVSTDKTCDKNIAKHSIRTSNALLLLVVKLVIIKENETPNNQIVVVF